MSIGVRYSSQMTDHYIGQLACVNMPHSSRCQLYPPEDSDNGFPYVRCLLGFLNYLMQLTLNDDGTIGIAADGHYAMHEFSGTSSDPERLHYYLPISLGGTLLYRDATLARSRDAIYEA